MVGDVPVDSETPVVLPAQWLNQGHGYIESVRLD
jgi:hypothetical protein